MNQDSQFCAARLVDLSRKREGVDERKNVIHYYDKRKKKWMRRKWDVHFIIKDSFGGGERKQKWVVDDESERSLEVRRITKMFMRTTEKHSNAS